jgi:hypothetical protein
MHILNLGLYLPSDIPIALLAILNAGAPDDRLLLMQLARLLGSLTPLFMCESALPAVNRWSCSDRSGKSKSEGQLGLTDAVRPVEKVVAIAHRFSAYWSYRFDCSPIARLCISTRK